MVLRSDREVSPTTTNNANHKKLFEIRNACHDNETVAKPQGSSSDAEGEIEVQKYTV